MSRKAMWMLSAPGVVLTLLLGVLATPLAVGAQAGRIPRIGLLFTGAPPPESSRSVAAFRAGLRELGYVEGQNIRLEYRWDPEGRTERPPVALAADLARLGVDVIVAQTTPHALAAKQATSTIPIVFGASSDPVRSGLVASLARPGRNVTGLSLLATDVTQKLIELLKDTVPNVSHVVALAYASGLIRTEMETAAKTLGVRLEVQEVREPKDLDRAFQAATTARAQGVMTLPSHFFATHRARVAELALKSRLPAVSIETGFAEAGGLMSYGPNIPDNFRRLASYVDKILKGAKPADLPVEQPTKFDLVVNLKTAKALGLTIPPSVLTRADRVIE
jgi:putative tryptophan/tyrosine transport system substrate-binding protein